ncbi:hypothetical protein KJ836_02660 [Patescibacteria group bacterium]|nr:hypothetical protein [Patescibacteria group bacterium]
MKKLPIGAFTIAYGDPRNLVYAGMMANSLRHFHPEIPLIIYTDEDVEAIKDERKTYRMYAMFGKRMAKRYETVIQIDSDSIVTGNLNHILKDKSYTLGGVLNNNSIDPLLSIHDIPHQVYLNAGFIVSRSERFWNWWDELNHRIYFNNYQFAEQDTYNMIFHYGDIKSKIFDYDMKPNLHGLIHKGKWDKFEMNGNQLVLPAETPDGEDKIIKIIHWAGGNIPKMNFETFFQPEVVKYLKDISSDKK